jgi:threonine aldolase
MYEFTVPTTQPLNVIDLRSDTVTKPTPAMRKAMSEAIVGDDVFRDDPTVLELERQTALLFGKESALFVPSGTMGNLISCLVHCSLRGSELIVGHDAHIHFYEQGGVSTLGGIATRVLQNQNDGTIKLSVTNKYI